MDGALPGLRPRLQRADGALDLTFGPGPRGAALRDLRQSSPLRALFPTPEPDEVPVIAVVNTAGGLAGGDRIAVDLRLGAGARVTASAAAAEKVYRALDVPTLAAVRLDVGAGAALEWIPQETILFDGARLHRRTEADLAPDAALLLADMLVLGRAARGETFARGEVLDSWRLRRDGRLIWADGLRLDGDLAPLRHPFGLDGAGATATLLLASPGAEAHLPLLRETLDGAPAGTWAGATVPRAGLLLARFLGGATAVRRALAAAIVALRHAALRLPSRLPRLWTT